MQSDNDEISQQVLSRADALLGRHRFRSQPEEETAVPVLTEVVERPAHAADIPVLTDVVSAPAAPLGDEPESGDSAAISDEPARANEAPQVVAEALSQPPIHEQGPSEPQSDADIWAEHPVRSEPIEPELRVAGDPAAESAAPSEPIEPPARVAGDAVVEPSAPATDPKPPVAAEHPQEALYRKVREQLDAEITDLLHERLVPEVAGALDYVVHRITADLKTSIDAMVRASIEETLRAHNAAQATRSETKE